MMGDHPSSITRSAFRRMSGQRKKEVMLEWFHANYEDPAERTPYESAEGGYQWIWGGPYNASEEFGGTFYDVASETLIQRVVDEVQSDGLFVWAPTPRREDYEPIEEADVREKPPSLEDIPDEAGPAYGTREDYEVRQRSLDALNKLNAVLGHPADIGIGHNRPPETLTEDVEETFADLRPTVADLSAELRTQEPKIPVVKRLASKLGEVIFVAGYWAARKIDKMADEAAKTMGKAIGVVATVAIEPHVQAAIHDAFNTVLRWLHLVTSPF
jgi:hypothetical protein